MGKKQECESAGCRSSNR